MFDLMRYPYLTFSFNLVWQGPPGDQGNRGPTGRPGKPVSDQALTLDSFRGFSVHLRVRCYHTLRKIVSSLEA